ncbi:MIP family channel protein [Anopheles sinensis]|uniref:MIP family channel protein n=1 Tax=Anopheles sinensis TaxID=74873 RepID=A0A084W0B0_ANOSI|nr:MIP family channel protein [Anopheles sinensis]
MVAKASGTIFGVSSIDPVSSPRASENTNARLRMGTGSDAQPSGVSACIQATMAGSAKGHHSLKMGTANPVVRLPRIRTKRESPCYALQQTVQDAPVDACVG